MTNIKDTHAVYREEERLIIIQHPVSGAKKTFLRSAEAIAWGNPLETDKSLAHSAIVLAAEAEDHKITVLRSFQGEVSLVRRKAVEFKDIFLASKVYAPPEPSGHYDGLLREDGLLKYQTKPPYVNLLGKPVYRVSEELAPTEWPSYRNRRTRASVMPHDDRLLVDFEAGTLLVERLIQDRIVNLDILMVPTLEAARKKELKERLRDVPYRAMVGVVWELYRTIRIPKTDDMGNEKPIWNPWYNRKRS